MTRIEDDDGRLVECLLTHSHMGQLSDSNRAGVLALINRHTDVAHAASIHLRQDTSTITVFCTDTNGSRYLVKGEPATSSIEIDEGLSAIQ